MTHYHCESSLNFFWRKNKWKKPFILTVLSAYWVYITSYCLYRHYWEPEIDVRCSWMIMRMLIIICQLIENAVAIVCVSGLLLSVFKRSNVLQQVFWSLLSGNFLYRSFSSFKPLWIRLAGAVTKGPSIFMPAAWISIIQTCNWMWVLGGIMNIQCHKY